MIMNDNKEIPENLAVECEHYQCTWNVIFEKLFYQICV